MTKPQLTNDDVRKLADLAKIEITENEVENYRQDINNILGHLAMVNEAVVAEVTTGEGENFFNYTREDVLVGEENRDFDKQIIFNNIPSKSKDNQVKVSKVI